MVRSWDTSALVLLLVDLTRTELSSALWWRARALALCARAEGFNVVVPQR